MVNFKQKEFGRNEKNDFHSTSESALRALIKLLVMGYHTRNANYHWTERTSTFILDAGKRNTKTIPRAHVFLGVTSEKERSKASGLVKDKFPETPENFIKRLWIEIASEKDRKGNLKYTGMINPSPSPKDIEVTLEKIRYIALCLTDQCIPENFRWDGESFRTPIKFETSGLDNIRTTPDLIKRLAQVVQDMGLGIKIKGIS